MAEDKDQLTYKAAGVDIDEGDRFIELIKPMARRTMTPGVMTGLGSFGALFSLDLKRYRDPVLVSGTDGVGTKLKVAFDAGIYETVGIDLVAMCVNDILTLGADPLFFLDYFATGRLRGEAAARVIEGIAAGCLEAGCALIGGETAEMPGFYKDGEFDLAGFAVGAVDRPRIVDGSRVTPGDVIIGLKGNGLHSNGYSLARKLFFEREGMTVDRYVPEFGRTLAEELLRPTRIYVKALQAAEPYRDGIVAMAHITGGGIVGNLPRSLPEGVYARVDEAAWTPDPVFGLIERLGNVPRAEMRRTFNMGIGYIIVCKTSHVQNLLETFGRNGYDSYVIGSIAVCEGEGMSGGVNYEHGI